MFFDESGLAIDFNLRHYLFPIPLIHVIETHKKLLFIIELWIILYIIVFLKKTFIIL